MKNRIESVTHSMISQ
jgi:hypothetical protein